MNDTGTAVTPMIRQYLEIKERHQDAIVFFRMGDFYEMFFEDAQLASRELGIALTSRARNNEEQIPFCGVPWHSSSQYISRLLAKGFKIVICEQTEQAGRFKPGRPLLKREAVRILTPGLSLEEDLLGSGEHRYLFAVYIEPEGVSGARFGLAKLDFTTGDFRVAEATNSRDVVSEIIRTRPPELLVRNVSGTTGEFMEKLRRISQEWLAHPNNLAVLEFDAEDTRDPSSATPLTDLQAKAASFCLSYLRKHQFAVPQHIDAPVPYSLPSYMCLDETTVRNLELTGSPRDRTGKNTLWDVLNMSVTPMGKRRLMEWMLYPLLDKEAIEGRLDSVEEGVKRREARESLQTELRGVCDLERLNAKNAVGQSSPRELSALRTALTRLPEIRARVKTWTSDFIREMGEKVDEMKDLADLLLRALVDDPPALAREGGFIRQGFSRELDELRSAVENGQKWLLDLERRERERLGIPTLKVKFHPVFGYLIEVTRAHLGKVPPGYTRRQTLAGAERFKVAELEEMENRILGSEEKAKALEQNLLEEVRGTAAGFGGRLKTTAESLGIIDASLSLAQVADERKYVRPTLHDAPFLRIRGGRHPVLERALGRDPFIENDLVIGGDQPFLMMITGPNMAGKSTYMRQAALMVIMAQMGSFVPAQEAEIGIADRIFTRIGASDDLAGGRSTFMVEMEEVAEILARATSRSLVLVDEVGRGTSTYDGVAIAWAVAEFLLERIKARTLFATHYHELLRLGDQRTGARNVHVAVKEWGNKIIFLHKVRDGGTSKSYGVQVARLAGLPEEVIQRAKTILFSYEQQRSRDVQPQYDLFQGKSDSPSIQDNGLAAEIEGIVLEKTSPMEAFQILGRLVDKVRGKA